jgi:glyoxylase-like metal-dependent hydrolase (beta-lactamase superfamily II)
VADGVWFLGGGESSVAVEFRDYVVVVEGPINEDRSLAVIAEVKRLVPSKPIRYLVNTHHHFDHSGGIRTYAAEGATIVTHEMNKPYYEKIFAAPRTLRPDKLALSGKKAKFETMTDKRVLTDGSRTLELHLAKGNAHTEGMIMAYLPKERMLIEADMYQTNTAMWPGFTSNMYENIQRLKLNVDRILPMHGPIFTFADLQKFVGQTSAQTLERPKAGS